MEIQSTLRTTGQKISGTQNQREPALDLDNHPSITLPMNSETRSECLALLSQIDILENRLSKLQKKYQGQSRRQSKKPRKQRRKKSQLDKSFKCIVSECHKQYGSITSLKLHLRSKHGMRVKKKRLRQQLITLSH